jgi:hypothetical protein
LTHLQKAVQSFADRGQKIHTIASRRKQFLAMFMSAMDMMVERMGTSLVEEVRNGCVRKQVIFGDWLA